MKLILAVCLLPYLFLACNSIPDDMDKPEIRIGIFADVQYCDSEPFFDTYYSKSLPKLEEAVKYMNKKDVDFTINMGDLVDRNFSDFDVTLPVLSQLNNKLISIAGNHDFTGVTNNQAVYDKLSMPAEYFTYELPGHDWLFVFLNTNEIASYANVKGTPKEEEYNAMIEKSKAEGRENTVWWNGGIGAAQMQWLDSTLVVADSLEKKALIFMHHPAYPNNAAINNIEILTTLENHKCVKAVFAGHIHGGNFGYYKDIPFITLEAMVETKKSNSYGTINLYDDKIVIEGKGRMKTRELVLR